MWLDLIGELFRQKLAGTLWYIDNRLRFAETSPLLVTEHCWRKGIQALKDEAEWKAKRAAEGIV